MTMEHLTIEIEFDNYEEIYRYLTDKQKLCLEYMIKHKETNVKDMVDMLHNDCVWVDASCSKIRPKLQNLVDMNLLQIYKRYKNDLYRLNNDHKIIKIKSNFNNIAGQKFGKLTVIKRVGVDKRGNVLWRCTCDCGNEDVILPSSNIVKGNTQSCGCLFIESHTTHGKTNTKLYHVHRGIKSRCYNPNHINYKYYGGRGIKVCDEWLNKENGFINFYNWAIEHGYNEGLSIDRINVNGNYEPSNCRWATDKEQINNVRNNRYLTICGKTHSINEWSCLLDISYSTIVHWSQKNWTEEKIIKHIKKHKGDEFDINGKE